MRRPEPREERPPRPRAVTIVAVSAAVAALGFLAAYLGGYEHPVDGLEVEDGVLRQSTEPVGLGFTVPVVALLATLATGLWLMRRWALLASVALLTVSLLALLRSFLLEADGETADFVVLLIFEIPLALALVALVRAIRAAGLVRTARR